MNYSPLQLSIRDAFISTEDNLLIQARAGSGKTSTLVMLADAVLSHFSSKSAIFLAFNKSIATELETRLPSRCPAKTFHSLGFSELRQRQRSLKSDPKKVMNIVEDLAPGLLYDDRATICRLVSTAKGAGVGIPPDAALIPYPPLDYKTFEHFADNLSLEDTEGLSVDSAIRFAMQALKESNLNTSVIDFDDMIYFPVLRKLALSKYDIVFVDEAQDISALQRDFIRKIARRVIVVGDARQAIYAFRGADSNSMNEFKEEFSCHELPLSITYRCPTKIVNMAKTIVPDFEAREGAPEGTVTEALLQDFDWPSIPSDAMVLCRNNKPLFDVVMKFLKIRKPFNVKGDFAADLKRFVKGRKASNLKQLYQRIGTWMDKEIAKAESAGNYRKVEAIIDKGSTLQDIITDLMADGKSEIAALSDFLDRITAATGGVTFTSIHKAKGLEAEHVYFLKPELIPSRYAKSDGELAQEDNLYYVAITRTKSCLTFLRGG